MNILAKIEGLNSDLYDELCEVLVLKTIQEHESYLNWTVLKGRNDTFELIFSKINEISEF